MSKSFYTDFSLHIEGIYGWGVGYFKPEYVEHWEKTMEKLHADGPYCFRVAHFCPINSLSSSKFVAEEFSCYNHPMEMAGHICSSRYVINHTPDWEAEIRNMFKKVISIIKADWPDVKLRFVLKSKTFELDFAKPTFTTDMTD